MRETTLQKLAIDDLALDQVRGGTARTCPPRDPRLPAPTPVSPTLPPWHSPGPIRVPVQGPDRCERPSLP